MTKPQTANEPLSGDVRARIIAAASDLIVEGGSEAATTRAVANAASVQAPTIYRLFGDKRGLLDAVAEATFAAYVADKSRLAEDADPVEDLRRGWDGHVAFGLANPAIFVLISATYPGPLSRAAAAGLDVLRGRVQRVARAGRLRVGEERAVDLLRATAIGTVLTLLGKAPEEHAALAAAAREIVFSAIIGEQATTVESGPSAVAAALRARLGEAPELTPGERLLLDELLKRMSG